MENVNSRCGRCRNCRRGIRHLCPNTEGIGVNRTGIFAEYACIPLSNLWLCDPTIPEEMYAIFETYGINMIEKNEDNTELILNAGNERVYDLVDKYYNIRYELDGGYTDVRNTTAEMFKAGQGVYLTISLSYAVSHFRDGTFAYGIVPYPMVNEEQDQYYTYCAAKYAYAAVIPTSLQGTNAEYAAFMLEAMAYGGRKYITPAYYETTLKYRDLRDDESGEMLDIIFATRVYDLGWYFQVGGYNESVMNLFRKDNNNFASMYKTASKIASKSLQKNNEAFQEAKASLEEQMGN